MFVSVSTVAPARLWRLVSHAPQLNTPLTLAAYRNSPECVEVLLKHGVDFTLENIVSDQPLLLVSSLPLLFMRCPSLYVSIKLAAVVFVSLALLRRFVVTVLSRAHLRVCVCVCVIVRVCVPGWPHRARCRHAARSPRCAHALACCWVLARTLRATACVPTVRTRTAAATSTSRDLARTRMACTHDLLGCMLACTILALQMHRMLRALAFGVRAIACVRAWVVVRLSAP